MNDDLRGIAAVGDVIAGRYRVEQMLGRGGMGAVYRVHDTRSGAALALKRGFARDPRRMKARAALLEREYHTLAQLAHPRIIEVYDYGVDAHGPYYTMELLDGADLDGRGQLPWRETCGLLLDVASSLAILHSRGFVHRDLSARNVRRTADGRAKLIDFGAMVSMGVAKDVVGTPPFMAPETLQNQTLDARADLYALGALGYYLLTGRHAYPARRIADLRDAWRSTPIPPARIVADVPRALSALIMQLVALDRGARPSSSAAVMTRLCAIAGLPADEHAAVRAYLTTPVLVGRDRALLAVRKRMLSLARGDGGALLVQGAAGSGRSRLLDACALEAKLLGAIVLRADASDGEHEPWSVARALGAQLLALMPKAAIDAARLSRDVLGHVLDGLGGEASAVMPERSLLIRELRDFLLSVARGQRLLIAVDDADLIDEPSAALLAALAVKTQRRHPVLLALSVTSDVEHTPSSPVAMLHSLCDPIALDPLSEAETHALMRSVFGDVPNLQLCSARIHALAQGNPRVTMELAQHLCDRGLVRYEAGRFTLPDQLGDGELPATLAASLSARLSRLGADARELALSLALADSDAPELEGYVELTSHGEPRRVFRGLDELVAERVLAVDARRYHFAQRAFVPLLRESADPAQAALLSSRIADLLARTGGDVLRRAQHLFGAGRDLEAIDLLRSINLLQRLPPLPLLEQALAAAERHALPARTVHELRMAVLSKAPFVLAWKSFQRCVPPVLERLERESGLVRYRELAHLPAAQRLTQALLDTQQRYLDTPEHDRVYGVSEAIRELGRLSGAFCSMAGTTISRDLLDSLPSLEPLRPLSPAIELVSTLVAAFKDWLAGRRGSRALYEQLLQRIAEPDHAGLDEAQYVRTHMGLHYSSGLIDAAMGLPAAERHAQVLETDRELRVNAWRVRQILKLAQGDVEEAQSCARRAELMQLQEGLEPRYLTATASYEFMMSAMGDDLLAAKSALDRIAVLAAHFPGWQPVLVYAQSRYRQMQGDPQGALDLLLPGFALVRPGRHVFFGYVAALHVTLLGELGRVDDALAHAHRYHDVFERERLFERDHPFYVATALAWARAGEHQRAVEMMDEVLAIARGLGQSGLAIGVLYETRARMAIWKRDREGFEHFAGLCGAEYGKTHNPALLAKFARLLEEAEIGHVAPVSLRPQILELVSGAATESEYDTVESRMRECIDDGDRARCALTMLLQEAESFAGYLYGLKNGALSLLAGLPERSPEAGMQDWLQGLAATELAADRDATATGEGETATQDPAPCRYVDAEGRSFEPLWLIARDAQGQRAPVAVLAYHVAPGPRTPPDRGLVAHIAAQLA